MANIVDNVLVALKEFASAEKAHNEVTDFQHFIKLFYIKMKHFWEQVCNVYLTKLEVEHE